MARRTTKSWPLVGALRSRGQVWAESFADSYDIAAR